MVGSRVPDYSKNASVASVERNPQNYCLCADLGRLSSIGDWLERVLDLSAHYNVLIKAHHNSIKHNTISLQHLPPNVHILPEEDLFSLFCVADVLISDISGAIFDALMCELPVVLVAQATCQKDMEKS